MTTAAIFTDQPSATELRRVISKLQGLPLAGVQGTRGVNAVMPPTWDGNGVCPSGWTQYQDSALANADALHFAAVVSPQVQASAVIPGLRARLTAPELATLTAGVAAVATLDATWATATPLADTVMTAQLDASQEITS